MTPDALMILEHVHEQRDGQAICRTVVTPDTACLHTELTTCRAEQARLQAEATDAAAIAEVREDDIARWAAEYEAEKATRQTAEAQVSTLTAALRRYGKHDRSCGALACVCNYRITVHEYSTKCQQFTPKPCTCGFDAVLRAASDAP